MIYKQLNDSAFADDEETKENINDDNLPDNSREPKSLQTESPQNDNEGNPERNIKNETVNTDREKNKSTQPEQDSVEKPEIKNENYINTTKTINQPASVQPSQSQSIQKEFSKTNDEDFEFSIDHITSMVANLGDESDEEEWARQEEVNQHQSNLVIPPNSSQQNMDPSILFVKKAEPGKNINGLQDWIYRDPQGEIQGLYFNVLTSLFFCLNGNFRKFSTLFSFIYIYIFPIFLF